MTEDAAEAAQVAEQVAQAEEEFADVSEESFDAVAMMSMGDLTGAATTVIGGAPAQLGMPLDFGKLEASGQQAKPDHHASGPLGTGLPRLSAYRNQDRLSVERGDRNEFVGQDARQHFFDLFQSESKWRNAEGETGGGSMLDRIGTTVASSSIMDFCHVLCILYFSDL
jgi:hypothetical protein